MICSNCDTQIPDRSDFCPYCGCKISEPAQAENRTAQAEGQRQKKKFVALIAWLGVLVLALTIVLISILFSPKQLERDKLIQLKQWIDRIENGPEEITAYVSSSTPEDERSSLAMVRDGTIEIKKDGSSFLTSKDGYDVFEITIIVDQEEQKRILTFRTVNDAYIYDFSQELYEQLRCPSCGGSGSISTGGIQCAICGGSGQQYIANAYYDGFMWQGQWIICSGCAGSGYMQMPNTNICSDCGGSGINRH